MNIMIWMDVDIIVGIINDMNLSTIIVLIVVIICAGFALRTTFQNKGGCSGCSGCHGCSTCSKKNHSNEDKKD